jgi:hypothetical protein
MLRTAVLSSTFNVNEVWALTCMENTNNVSNKCRATALRVTEEPLINLNKNH